MKGIKKTIIIGGIALFIAAVSAVSVFAIKGNGKSVAAQVPENFVAEPLSVVFVSPTGLLENHIRYPEIQIQFSDPVVALAQLGEHSDKCDYAEISPSLSGYWRWTGNSPSPFYLRGEDPRNPLRRLRLRGLEPIVFQSSDNQAVKKALVPNPL